jgi:hypothetical protein
MQTTGEQRNSGRQRTAAHNKNYMSIAVSVLTTSCVARNSGGAARQTNGQREFSGAKATRNRQLFIVPFVMGKCEKTGK